MKKVAMTIIVNGNGEVLVLKRSPDTTSPNTWNFPGGSVEKGELWKEGAVREVFEESNLIVQDNDLEYKGVLRAKGLVLAIFITNKFSGEVKINHESSEFKWVSLPDLKELEFPRGKCDNSIIEIIEKYSNETWRN